MRAAVVGHVEWVEFARVARVPAAGEIVHASESWAEPAGGGPVAAARLAELAGGAELYTALGDDELGHAARTRLEAAGVRVHAAFVAEPQRRAFTFVDDRGERTIAVLGDKLVPRGAHALPWERLAGADAVYFVSGDAAALRAARRARVLVATSRELPTLREGGVELDALVGSAHDPAERYAGGLEPPPRVVVRTEGALGGSAEPGGRYDAAPVPGPVVDAYGCGDAFAAALAYGLGAGLPREEALALAARLGAAALTVRGAGLGG